MRHQFANVVALHVGLCRRLLPALGVPAEVASP
jgi:hypothetical protein